MLGRWKKWMADSLLPFQCNRVDVEGLWKNTNTKKIQKLKREKVETDKEREGEKEERRRRRRRRNSCRGWSVHQHYLIRRPTAIRSPFHHQIGSDRLVLFFFFFIQLYCKNWILFFVLFLDYLRRFLRVKQSQIGLFFPAVVFLFLLFFCVFIFFRFRFKGNREKRFDHGSQNRVVEPRFERFPVFLT